MLYFHLIYKLSSLSSVTAKFSLGKQITKATKNGCITVTDRYKVMKENKHTKSLENSE